MKEAPLFPAGEYQPFGILDETRRMDLIRQLEEVPERVRASVIVLNEAQLDAKYRNWSIRQIIHHLADSHINCYVRFKWALTENTPQIKSYDETKWSDTVDARTIPLESSFRILEGVHARWGELLRLLTPEQWRLGFYHPELDQVVTLEEALPNYVWHADHHLAQIAWVREQHDW
jgi:hypothetical protein